MGVHVSKASPALRKHLKLPLQFGLLIEHVDPVSAAADAKLQRFDVLYKIDDQLLVNNEQLTALVRMRQPKEAVAVTLYRDGKSMQIKVVLKSGKVVDESNPNWWKSSTMRDFELKSHAAHTNFQNCRACHEPPFEHLQK